ncbi:MAG: 50S ribosomal protein L23 [Deltaproteobacteria bacterium]|nr:50S ribosomal protein L23 [Deltaproteobacteria bacterium]
MKGVRDAVLGPLISEKGSMLAESSNQVIFKVRPDANKIEIRRQVEALFKVTVQDVRTARYLGKMRRVGRNTGRLPLWKKAFVTLKEGDRIDFFGVG